MGVVPADAGVAMWGKDFEPTEHAKIVAEAKEQVRCFHRDPPIAHFVFFRHSMEGTPA